MVQVAVAPVPESVQLFEGLKVPAPLLLQVTVPVGVINMPGDVSVTVAWQVVETPGCTKLGEQVTLVEVVRLVTVKLNVPELPEWSGSPL
jgi:hypothetical protein